MALVLSAFVGVVYNRRCLLRGCVCLRLPSSSTPRDSVIPKCSIDVAASDRRPKRLLERAFFSGKKPPGHFRIFDGLFSYRNRLLVLSQSIRPSRGVRFRFLSDLFDLRERFGIPSLATKQRRAVTVFPVFPCLKKPLVTGGASDGESQFHARWLT